MPYLEPHRWRQDIPRRKSRNKTDRKRVNWTAQEDEALRRLYPDNGARAAAEATGRSVIACRRRAFDLGIGHRPTRVRALTRLAQELAE